MKINNNCRNCLSNKTVKLNSGFIMPFFLKRVHNMYIPTINEYITLTGRQVDKVFSQDINQQQFNSYIKSLNVSKFRKSILKRLMSIFLFVFNKTKTIQTSIKIHSIYDEIGKDRIVPRVNIIVCESCSFVTSEHYYDYESLLPLYIDYSSDTYNSERVIFEPDYIERPEYSRRIDNEVNRTFSKARLEMMDSFINKYINADDIKTLIDWAGGNGKYVPTLLKDKNVYLLEVSDEKSVYDTYIKVSEPPEDVIFDYVQLCHILEHVASPYEFMTNVLKHVKSGGYVYIELPQDRTNEDIERFVSGDTSIHHYIHEHLNLFTEKSLQALANSLSLKTIRIQKLNSTIMGIFTKQ